MVQEVIKKQQISAADPDQILNAAKWGNNYKKKRKAIALAHIPYILPQT